MWGINQNALKSGWTTNCNRILTMYSSYCGTDSHKNQIGTYCYEYQKYLYHLAQYQGTVAHEFGHVFGLQDMYYSATINHGYEPFSNEELIYDRNGIFALPQTKGIMLRNGSVCANDIEMILLAFSENTWQYYVPYGTTQIPSKAIKNLVQYRYGDSNTSVHVWDDDNKDFI